MLQRLGSSSTSMNPLALGRGGKPSDKLSHSRGIGKGTDGYALGRHRVPRKLSRFIGFSRYKALPTGDNFLPRGRNLTQNWL